MSQLIDTLHKERDDLSLHVQLCEQRYNQLLNKFETVDSRLDKIETMLEEIDKKLTDNKTLSYKKYLSWSGALILILVSAIATIITNATN